MPLNKSQKKEIISDLGKIFKESQGAVFVGFKGLKVNTANTMRRGFTSGGVGYVVAKKTLMSRALDEAKFEGTRPEFTAEVAVAYAGENLAPSREVWNFLKKNKDALQVLGGVFEGKFISKADVLAYATIPDQKTLYAQFVNLINSPIQRFAVALNEIAKSKPQA